MSDFNEQMCPNCGEPLYSVTCCMSHAKRRPPLPPTMDVHGTMTGRGSFVAPVSSIPDHPAYLTPHWDINDLAEPQDRHGAAEQDEMDQGLIDVPQVRPPSGFYQDRIEPHLHLKHSPAHGDRLPMVTRLEMDAAYAQLLRAAEVLTIEQMMTALGIVMPTLEVTAHRPMLKGLAPQDDPDGAD